MSPHGLGYPGGLRLELHILTATTLLAAACGRLGFDDNGASTVADAGSDACAPGGCDPFQPSVGGCTLAESGPFNPVASYPTQGGGYGVFSAPPFVLAADTTGGLTNLRFDGSTFTKVGALDGIGWVEAVWSDGAVLYVGAPGTGLAVVAMGSDGRLTLKTQNTTAVAEARRGWVANGLIYVPSGPDGLFAFQFDGASLVQVGAKVDSMGWSQGAWAKGARVLFADANVFRVLDFDGSTFTDVITPDTTHGGNSRVWSDGDTMFVANGDGATAYRLVTTAVGGPVLVELDHFALGTSARDIWSDGQHVFVAGEASGLYALRFDNDRFALVDQISTGAATLGVFGDGTYIYANDLTGGLQAFSGFACTSW